MNDSSGPGWLTPSRLPSQPHWCTATVDAERRAHRQEEPAVATTGTTTDGRRA